MGLYNKFVNFGTLKGKTFTEVEIKRDIAKEYDCINFYCTDGTAYKMYHEQDCCESVDIEDINGNIYDILGSEILIADESIQEGGDNWGTCTWTFYRLATVKGYVDIRWFGESNGYYSESVSLREMEV